MLFNSLDFAIFLPLVFIGYWLVLRDHAHRNVLLLVASYVFYGWWDYRFLGLILLSSLVDYAVAIAIGSRSDALSRRVLLAISLIANLGMLCAFKYYGFFAENLEAAFSFMGHPLQLGRMDIVLPVGISFYTFQTMSYTIDVYRGQMAPRRDLVSFLAYVSFFPQLVAGPIERAANLLPQFEVPRVFNRPAAVDGLRQMLWGLAKKVVIADNCAAYVDSIFSEPGGYSGSSLLIGAILFSFQIYCDFSGYSDMAIGCARLFGFDLMRNFAYPYFSRDISEFWRRWHISLSTWFRDYVYIPLGGSRGGAWGRVRNTLVIFGLSGFWHGANWTFIAWGLLNAIFFLPLLLAKRNRRNLDTAGSNGLLPSPREAISILSTYVLTVLAWVFFRAASMSDAWAFLAGMADPSLFSFPEVRPLGVLASIAFLVLFEWIGRSALHPLQLLERVRFRAVRWGIYYALIAVILALGGKEQEFIYFQF